MRHRYKNLQEVDEILSSTSDICVILTDTRPRFNKIPTTLVIFNNGTTMECGHCNLEVAAKYHRYLTSIANGTV